MKKSNADSQGKLKFESAKTVHLILLCYFGDGIRWAVSAVKKDGRSQSSLGKNYTLS